MSDTIANECTLVNEWRYIEWVHCGEWVTLCKLSALWRMSDAIKIEWRYGEWVTLCQLSALWRMSDVMANSRCCDACVTLSQANDTLKHSVLLRHLCDAMLRLSFANFYYWIILIDTSAIGILIYVVNWSLSIITKSRYSIKQTDYKARENYATLA